VVGVGDELRPTPYLCVDLPVVEANVAAMAAHARELGVALRPHAKTHKSLELARLQLEAGAVGLTVATIGEAEAFAAAGFRDLFVGYPLYVDAPLARRIRALLDHTRLRLAVDSAEGCRVLADALGPDAGAVEVMIEVDSGQHRTGVEPAHAGAVAQAAVEAGLDLAGVFTFPGHGYTPGGRALVAREETDALARAVDAVARAGFVCQVVSGGSTPTAEHTAPGVVSELRPGVYVFGDAQQWELGTVGPDRIALACVTSVVSVTGDRVALDAGSKSVGADRAPWASGFGRLLEHPDALVTLLSEHRAVVVWDHSPLPRLGDRLRLVPNHVCSAVNLADELVVSERGVETGSWRVVARGANT
jgi:D-serine deaminase-like pyridoxal phosphate-dependent protein